MTSSIRCGDVLVELRKIESESIQCCITSPPYWGLRDYKVNGQFGLEKTPEEYVAKMMEVFREVKRVLRKDGTLWLNIGDSYASETKGSGGPSEKQLSNAGSFYKTGQRFAHDLKSKDLCGIPWRVAFALQADGWYLRSDIIWHKPNPMPESVTDRPTKAHEYLFLLAKSQHYYFDQEAVREPYDKPMNRWGGEGLVADGKSAWDEATGQTTYRDRNMRPNPNGRNIRTVWTIPTQPFPEAHFATFPEKLVEPCIRVGTSERGCCAKCGAPWEREVRRNANPSDAPTDYKTLKDKPREVCRGDALTSPLGGGHKRQEWLNEHPKITVGWHPTCSCQVEIIPCTVFDPFCGSGTTGVVALKLGRNFIGIDLKPEYCEMARRRIESVMPLFQEVGMFKDREKEPKQRVIE